MKTLMTTLTLILLAGLATALAGDLPAQAQRIWAPAGDVIGNQNHLTATGMLNDDHGDAVKAGEELDIFGEYLGQGLFGWRHVMDNSHTLRARGLFDNHAGGGLAGDGMIASTSPGTYRATLSYHIHDLRYDRDAELRNPTFPTVTPPQLAITPELEWRRGQAEVSYHVSSALDLRVGADDMRREGRKSALSRRNPPDVQTVDSQSARFWLGGTTRLGALAADLELSTTTSENDRTYRTGHIYADERDRYSASLDAAYDLSPAWRVLANGRMSRLEHTGSESGISNPGDTDGDTDSAAYQLAVLGRLGKATTVRASARLDVHDTEASLLGVNGDAVQYAADRERDRQQYQVVIGNRSLPRTSLKLRYRYTSGESNEIIGIGGRPGHGLETASQSLDQESTRHDASLRVRTRLARHVKLTCSLRHSALEVDQDRTWDTDDDQPWFGVLGDHERDRTMWRLALQTRPSRRLPVDVGLRGFDQTFQRTGEEMAETQASMVGVFANANWLATDRLTVFTMVTYGSERYELTGVEPVGSFEAFNVDATTLRLSPGAMVQLTECLQLEGWYEGVFFEDTGDESDSLNAIEADRDRLQVRARWQAMDRLAVTAGYARNELDENRWDDYIQHLWTLSAHTGF